MPSFNRAKYLERALTSVLRQNYKNVELIVIDSNSQDESRAIMAKFKGDPHFVEVDRDDNLGPNVSRQQAFEMCHGDYVLNMDSDDELSVDYLERMGSFAAANDLDIVSATCKIMDENENIRDDRGAYAFKKNAVLRTNHDYQHVLKMRYGS